jgi:Tol biopolymer transport system component
VTVARSPTARNVATRILFLVSLLCLLPVPVFAQYFGRNKVVYKDFDFSVLKTDHFLLYHYPGGGESVQEAARILERWYTRHQEVFGYGIAGPQKVILYDSVVDFQQTNAIPGLISPGEGGVTESLADRIIVPLTGVSAENDHVLAHELVHAFQFQRARTLQGLAPGPQPQPLWFVEGMAEFLSKGKDDPLTAMWMRDAALHGDIPSIQELSSNPNRYFPYRFGEELWAFVARTWGDSAVRSFFDGASTTGLTDAVSSALGLSSVDQLSARWKTDILSRYAPQLAGRTYPKDVGNTLPGLGPGVNLAPVISPDGTSIAVFSRRDLFSLDLFLVDAATGRRVRPLVSSETNTHYDALNFINDAGAWSPDSRSFAFIVQKTGHDAVAIADVAAGKIRKVIPFTDIADISGLAWSPDGARIALAATMNAQSDIWLLDPDSGAVERLTNDRYAELQPAWSPDGKTLLFATDRGGKTDFAALRFGSMNLGMLDVADRRISILFQQDGVKHIDPQYSPDGQSIYFVADPDGVSDIYRYSLTSHEFFRITSVQTGVSGLTELSPCLSVSRGTGALVFTLFNRRGYEVHSLDPAQAAGAPVQFAGALDTPTPFDQPEAAPPNPPVVVSPYRPTFQLLSVSGAGVGLSLDQFGPAVGGSVDFVFQDVLGNHLIDAAARINGSLDTLGGQLVYANSTHRVQWGIGIAHVPQPTYLLLPAASLTVPGADTGIVQQQIFTEEADLMAQYPLDLNRRLETDLGYTRISYEQTAPVFYYSVGELIGQDQVTLVTPPSLDLFHGGLAWVGDYSYFGFTDPVKGYRYRLEVDGYSGSLSFLTTIADIRAYLFAKPLTFAFRALHVGRWLADSGNPSLSQYYLGDPGLVRGYEYSSILSSEGAAAATGDIPQIDRLFGTRIAVFNAELRLPFLGNTELGIINFPYLPASLVAFLDGGMAWSDAQPIELTSYDPGAHVPVFSAGAAVRFNLLGAAVLQFYWAWPFQRPDIGGSWGLVIASGW